MKNADGNMPFHLACIKGSLDCVKVMVENKFKVNTPGKDKMRPLHFAAAHNNFEIVEYLIKVKKATINSKDKF